MIEADPVCFTGVKAGPDWPGIVREKVQQTNTLDPAFLQGHAGDVNPGDGKPWLGNADKVGVAVHAALVQAIDTGQIVRVAAPSLAQVSVPLALDITRFQEQLAFYRKHPTSCTSGVWVAKDFAEQWARRAEKWDSDRRTLSASVSAVNLGDLSMLFHPSELYSYYGLRIVHGSPFPHTLAIGYTDGFVGYLTDPAAYEKREYAALTVPKALSYPPFKTTTAQDLTDAAVELLQKVASSV